MVTELTWLAHKTRCELFSVSLDGQVRLILKRGDKVDFKDYYYNYPYYHNYLSLSLSGILVGHTKV